MFLHRRFCCSIKICLFHQTDHPKINLNKRHKQFLTFPSLLSYYLQIFLKITHLFLDKICHFHSSFRSKTSLNIPFRHSSEKRPIHVSYHLQINLNISFHLRKFIFLGLKVCYFAIYLHRLVHFLRHISPFLKIVSLKILLDKKIHHKRSKFHHCIRLILL